MALTIIIIITVFLCLIQAFIPYLVKRTAVFGVTIPEHAIKNEKLQNYKKTYTFVVLLASFISLGIYMFWALTNSQTEELIVLVGVSFQFAIIFISTSLYFYFHGKTGQLKKTLKFTKDLKQVQIADLTVRTRDEMLTWYAYLVPIFITIGLIIYTVLQYDLLPNQIPTHWGPNGQADAFTTKTPFSVITLPLTLFIMQLMFLGINIGTKKSGIKLSATATNVSRLRQLTLRKYSSWFLFIISLLVTMMFSFIQLTMIHPDIMSDKVAVAAPFIFLLVVLIGTIIFAVKVGFSDKQTDVYTGGNIADMDDDAHWKGGIFYVNKNDPSIFVEKRFGVGWTINFGNPIAYLLVVVPIVVILLISFL